MLPLGQHHCIYKWFLIIINTLKMKKLIFLFLLLPLNSYAETSTCFGTTSDGRLENGVQLPEKGKNFVTYSSVAHLAGRTYVHSLVKNIIINAYAALEYEQPNKVFKYAETGFKEGGPFKPHKTHRNGLSVDFMTPVLNTNNKSVHLPTHVLNRFGYNIKFNSKDKYQDLTIDYEAMAAHIMLLHKSARASGVDLWRVIFDPQLQARLLKTKYAPYLINNIQFSKRRSWVRHDEHYHVDFSIPCK